MQYRRRRPRVAHDITRLAPAGVRKPAWVADEVLRLAVHLQGCRSVAITFNRLHGSRASVGKTWVNELCNARAAELLAMRRDMRARAPRPCPVGERWALDLTFIPAAAGPHHTVLGIIDHGSRLALRLKVLPRKCTWTLLGHVCLTIAAHGRPRSIRTDNESMLTSRLWRRAFKFFGIRHQLSDVGCPWQNGRIERFFGTMKASLRQVPMAPKASLQGWLDSTNSPSSTTRCDRIKTWVG
jgi:putative transposase